MCTREVFGNWEVAVFLKVREMSCEDNGTRSGCGFFDHSQCGERTRETNQIMKEKKIIQMMINFQTYSSYVYLIFHVLVSLLLFVAGFAFLFLQLLLLFFGCYS